MAAGGVGEVGAEGVAEVGLGLRLLLRPIPPGNALDVLGRPALKNVVRLEATISCT